MNHEHSHGPGAFNQAFALGVGLNLAFVAAEAASGVIAASTALLADAAHNFSDVLGLLLAWGASHLARRPRSPRRTYGWRSSSILAALLNAIVLLVVAGGIDPEAVEAYLVGLAGVTAVHDVHIWAMSTTETALTAHLVKQDAQDDEAIIAEATRALHKRFGIAHTTLQWEHGPDACCPRVTR